MARERRVCMYSYFAISDWWGEVQRGGASDITVLKHDSLTRQSPFEALQEEARRSQALAQEWTATDSHANMLYGHTAVHI